MRIKVTTDFIVLDGNLHRRGEVLEQGLTKYDKQVLVMNGQAEYTDEPDTNPAPVEEKPHDE